MTEIAERNATPRTKLPNDVARCAGIGDDAEGWHDDCEDCMRKVSSTAVLCGFVGQVLEPRSQ